MRALLVDARGALTARWRPRDDDVVADGERGDGRADLGDHTGTFVTRHEGHALRQVAVDGVQVRVADPRGLDVDLHVAWSDGQRLDVVEDVELLAT